MSLARVGMENQIIFFICWCVDFRNSTNDREARLSTAVQWTCPTLIKRTRWRQGGKKKDKSDKARNRSWNRMSFFFCRLIQLLAGRDSFSWSMDALWTRPLEFSRLCSRAFQPFYPPIHPLLCHSRFFVFPAVFFPRTLLFPTIWKTIIFFELFLSTITVAIVNWIIIYETLSPPLSFTYPPHRSTRQILSSRQIRETPCLSQFFFFFNHIFFAPSKHPQLPPFIEEEKKISRKGRSLFSLIALLHQCPRH